LGNIALGVGLNVVFNYVLIYGRCGLPALGVTGAALGTLLARCLMLAHFAWLLRRQRDIAPAPGSWRPAAVRGGMYREYLPIALPFAAITVAMVGNTVVVSSLMSRFGEVTLAAHEIVRQLTFLLFTVSQAFSFAVAIRVGQAAGANDTQTVRRVAWSSVCVAGAAMCLIGVAVALGRHVLPGWFIKASTSGGETVIGLASGYLAMVAWSLPAEALTYTSVGAFRGLANLRASATIYVCGMWLVCLPLAYALGFRASGGGLGVWRGLMIGNWATAFVLVGLLWRTLQRRPMHA
jgi:MATE family multidrug resistance protein